MAKEKNLIKTYPVIGILGTISTGTVFIYLGLWFFVLKHNYSELADESSSPIAYLVSTLKQLFRYADDWNWLLLSFLFALLVIVFSIVTYLTSLIFSKITVIKHDKKRTFLFWLIRSITSLTVTFIVIIIFGYIVNVASTSPRIYSLEEFEKERFERNNIVIVVLGTSKYLRGSGNLNIYYSNRISTTIKLSEQYPKSIIFISGDKNLENNYDEPRDIKMDLIKGEVINDKHNFSAFEILVISYISSHSNNIF